jgi:hypothetical protein
VIEAADAIKNGKGRMGQKLELTLLSARNPRWQVPDKDIRVQALPGTIPVVIPEISRRVTRANKMG